MLAGRSAEASWCQPEPTLTWRPSFPKAGQVAAVFVGGSSLPLVVWGWAGVRSLRFYPNGSGYRALLPLPLAGPSSPLSLMVVTLDWYGHWSIKVARLTVRKRSFPRQIVQLPAERQPLLDPHLLEEENREILPIYKRWTPDQLWDGPFRLPIGGRVGTPFGVLRRFRGSPDWSRHLAIDVASPPGRPVEAIAGGLVVWAGETPIRGRAIILDHGQGVFSSYYHLGSLAVRAGRPVHSGALLGTVGATGRATGPHLHWSIRVEDRYVDPLQWIEETFWEPPFPAVEIEDTGDSPGSPFMGAPAACAP